MSREGKSFDDKLSQKSLAIICLLLSAPDMKMRKSKISSLLWMDSDIVAAKSNLRFNVWSIKKIVGQDAQGEDLIVSEREFVRMNKDYRFQSDILAIKAFEKSRAYDAEQLIGLRKSFQGEYLEGFYLSGCDEFADIILIERMSCQNIHKDILNAMYNLYLNSGNIQSCIQIMQEALLIDPFNESFAYRIIEHLITLHQLTQAIGFYKDFAVRLRKNLNVAPSGDLLALYRKLSDAQRRDTAGDMDVPGRTVAYCAGTKSENPAAEGEDSISAPRRVFMKSEDPAADEANPIAAPRHVLKIDCIPEVAYCWMSECADQVFALCGGHAPDGLHPSAIADLAYIYPKFFNNQSTHFGNCCTMVTIPDIRLFYALRDCLEAAAGSEGALEIVTEHASKIDGVSLAFLKFMEMKPLKSVVFRTGFDLPGM